MTAPRARSCQPPGSGSSSRPGPDRLRERWTAPTCWSGPARSSPWWESRARARRRSPGAWSVSPGRWPARSVGTASPMNRSARGLKALRRHVQLVLQDPSGALNPRHTVYDSVAEGLRVHRLVARSGKTETELVAQALSSAGLRPPEGLFLRYPHELSGWPAPAGADRGRARRAAPAADRRRAGVEPRRVHPRRDPRPAAQVSASSSASACWWSPTTSAWRGTSPTGSR